MSGRGWVRPFLLAGLVAFIAPQLLPAASAAKRLELKKLRTDKFNATVLSFDLSAGDLCAVALNSRRVVVSDLSSGKIVKDIAFPAVQTDPRLMVPGESEPMRVRFSDDGTELAVSSLSRIYLFDTANWREIATLGVAGEDVVRPIPPEPSLPPRPVLKIRPAGPPVPDTSLNRAFRRWFEVRARGDGRTRITDFVFAPSGDVLAAYCRGACFDDLPPNGLASPIAPSGDPLRLWNARTGKIIWERVEDPQGVIERLAISPNARFFAAAIARHIQPGEVGLFRLADGGLVEKLNLALSIFYFGAPSLIFSAGGRQIITALPGYSRKPLSLADHLCIFDGITGAPMGNFGKPFLIGDADGSADGKYLAVTTQSGVALYIYDLARRQPVARALPSWTTSVWWIRISPDARYVVTLSDQPTRAYVYRLYPP